MPITVALESQWKVNYHWGPYNLSLFLLSFKLHILFSKEGKLPISDIAVNGWKEHFWLQYNSYSLDGP